MDATLRHDIDPEGDQPLRRGMLNALSLVVSRRLANSELSDPRNLFISRVSGNVERSQSLLLTPQDLLKVVVYSSLFNFVDFSERSVADLRRALKLSRSNRDSGL